MDNRVTLLRACGLKATSARLCVLTLLADSKRPLSHGEIEARLAEKATKRPNRVTLYRVLDALVTAQLLTRAVDMHGVSRFALRTMQRRHERHVHFRCTDCGGVYCLKAPPPAVPRLPRGFHLEGLELDIRGTCAACGRGGIHP